MKVLIVNTAERTGGAAIAANRLLTALNRQGITAKMLVRDRKSDDTNVMTLNNTVRNKVNFVWERFVIWSVNGFSRRNLWDVDIANVGTDITRLPEFQEADVIHLHWINQGFLSLDDIARIVATGKPVVWTMHDMWPFTGICHYSNECELYKSECHDCPQLIHGSRNDLSAKTFKKKQEIYRYANITFVGCSRWIADLAGKSVLTRGKRIVNIPNAIDTQLFRPTEKIEARKNCCLPVDKKLILFGAAKTTDPRKGMNYLIDALKLLTERYDTFSRDVQVVLVGGRDNTYADTFPLTVHPMGYVSDEWQMVEIYNAADIYVTPSLQDNLPNTIVEAMACGLPCVGFNTGGVPQMITHGANGYVAEYRSADDLANGIHKLLFESDLNELSREARATAVSQYSEPVAASRYADVYRTAIKVHTQDK